MDDRVLDEGLHGEGRDGEVEGGRIRPQLQAQPVAQAQPLQLEVARDEGPLVAQGHAVHLPLLHAHPEPQQLAQALDGGLRPRGIAPDEAEERVQRVEDEVRVELRAQQLQLGPRVERLCAAGPVLGLAGARPVVPRVPGAEKAGLEGGVHHRLPEHDLPRGEPPGAHHEAGVDGGQEQPARGGGDRDGERGQGGSRDPRASLVGPGPAAGQVQRDPAQERVGQDHRRRRDHREARGRARGHEHGRVSPCEHGAARGVGEPSPEPRRVHARGSRCRAG